MVDWSFEVTNIWNDIFNIVASVMAVGVAFLIWMLLRRFSMGCATILTIGAVFAVLMNFSFTEGILQSLGVFTSKSMSAEILDQHWLKDPSKVFPGPDGRVVTLRVHNHTDKFFRQFTLICETAHRDIIIADGTGIVPHEQNAVRSYRIPAEAILKDKCVFNAGHIGKPNNESYYESSLSDKSSWQDRLEDVQLPEDPD